MEDREMQQNLTNSSWLVLRKALHGEDLEGKEERGSCL